MRLLLPLLLSCLLGGCFMQNASPTKKLAESVHDMNEAVRWGRLGHAAGHVRREYLTMFMESRQGWGERIQVAMSEVNNLNVAEDNESAVAVVSYSWYGYRTMTLERTVVRQDWKNEDGDFGLAGEVVVMGNPELFRGKLPSEIPDEDGDISLLGDSY